MTESTDRIVILNVKTTKHKKSKKELPTLDKKYIYIQQGFSKFRFKGPNRNYHQSQKVRNNCYYKTCFYKHAYNFI